MGRSDWYFSSIVRCSSDVKKGKEMDIGESDLYSCMSSLLDTDLPAIALTDESTYIYTRQDTQGQYSLCTIFYKLSREKLSEYLG